MNAPSEKRDQGCKVRQFSSRCGVLGLFARACISRDRRGVVAVLFALMLLPLIGLIGLAIDFAVVSQAKQQLDLALDAATMQAVTSAAQASAINSGASLAPAEAAGVQRFTAQAGTIVSVTVQPASIVITPNGTQYTAVGTYTGVYKTYLGAIFGFANMTINGTATAVYQVQPYTDVEILLDTSSSMLVAAGTTAQNNALTSQTGGCLFACHTTLASADYYPIAKLLGTPLRVDQLRTAISTIANSIAAANTGSRYRFGVWTFADTVSTLSALTTNISLVANLVNLLAPEAVDILNFSVNIGNTQLDSAITSFAPLIGTAGDGTSASAPRKYVFLMTDGVQDVTQPGNSRTVSPITPSYCNSIKSNKNVTLAILYTPFIFSNDPAFDEVIQLYTPVDTVLSALQQCASSPDLVFSASTQDQINSAAQEFLTSVLGIPAHLSN